MIKIKFEGVDFFCRPVFKEIDGNRRYGSVDRLVSTREELDKITEFDLCYFGRSFDCEPLGSTPGDIKIVWDSVNKEGLPVQAWSEEGHRLLNSYLSLLWPAECEELKLIHSRSDGPFVSNPDLKRYNELIDFLLGSMNESIQRYFIPMKEGKRHGSA